MRSGVIDLHFSLMRCNAEPSGIPMASSAHHGVGFVRVQWHAQCPHQKARSEQLEPFSALSAKCSTPLSATGCDGPQRKPARSSGRPGHANAIDQRAMIAVQLTSPDLSRRQEPRRSTAAIEQDERSGILPVENPPRSPRNFGLSIPGSSTRRSPHFSSAATRKASGLPVTSTGGSAEFSCLRTPHCRLQEGTADRRDAQPYFRPRGSNSTSKTTAIRLSRTSDR